MWVNRTLKNRDAIIDPIKSILKKSTYKYGIEVLTSVKYASSIDEKNGNNLWIEAVKMEMENVGVAFQILEDDQPLPIGFTKSSGHLVWDVKMDFTRKTRFVKDDHKTADLFGSNFAGVVLRDKFNISSTYASLKNLGVFYAGIKNAYIQTQSSEKHHIICGPEFGDH